MADRSHIEQILRLERAVLRALCSDPARQTEDSEQAHDAPRGALSEALREFADYRWRGDEHRVVFRALAALKPSRSENVAEQLPAQATRMGFPDVDWKLYLESSATLQTEVTDLISALKSSVGNETQTRG